MSLLGYILVLEYEPKNSILLNNRHIAAFSNVSIVFVKISMHYFNQKIIVATILPYLTLSDETL